MTDAQKKAREIAEEMQKQCLLHYSYWRVIWPEDVKQVTNIIARHIEGQIKRHDNLRATLKDCEIGREKVRAERDALRARVEELEEALDIAEKALKIAIRDVCEEAKE